MADIILAGDSFSLKKLRNAAEQLEDAQNLMQKVYDAVFSTGFWAEANPFALLDGSKNMNVFDGTIDELNAFQQRVQQKEDTLRTLAQRIEAAVQELAETDQSFRGKLNGESSVKRAWNSFWDSIATASKIASTPAIPILAAIGRLFHSESTVVGETPIEAPAQKKIRFTDDEIETIYGEFDWRGISVTDEEKMAIVQRASDKWELHLLFEKLHNEKLDAMPPTEIRITNYADGAAVEAGKIRYASQNKNQNLAANGWGNYTNIAGGQCNSACESMALSYLGIDRSPGSMVPYGAGDDLGGLEVANYGTADKTWNSPEGTTVLIENRVGFNMDDIDLRVEKFSQDKNRGLVAPVMIRYKYFDGDPWSGHWLIITGKNADGTYNVTGPAFDNEKQTIVSIDKNGNISGSEISHGGGMIQRYAQYTVK